MLADHRRRDERDMRRHAGVRLAVASGRHRAQAGDEGEFFTRERRRIPAHLSDRHVALALRRSADQAAVDTLEAAGVTHSRADAIEPRALVRSLRRLERLAGKLLGIKPVVYLLRRYGTH